MSHENLAVEFFNNFGLGQLVESSNFKLFGELRDILKADKKYIVDFGGDVDFSYSLNNTQDLFDNQASLTDDMVAAWAGNAVDPLAKSLQECSEDLSAVIEIDSSDIGSYSGSFRFENIEDYALSLSATEAQQALDVLDEWKNTLEYFSNAERLKKLLSDTINEDEDEWRTCQQYNQQHEIKIKDGFMPNKIINIVLLEETENGTTFDAQASIAIQDSNKDTKELIKYAASELVMGSLENVCQSAMFADNSGLNLIEQLMQEVDKVNWIDSNYCLINTRSATVRFSVECEVEQSVTLSTRFSFIVEKIEILAQKPKLVYTIEGMTKNTVNA